MTRRILRVAAALAAVALLLAVAAVLVLQSGWLREKVRGLIVAEVEKATGGRAEVRGFQFDWRTLRATVDGFVLHGTEGPGKPPLFEARSISVGLKIVSLFEKRFDLESLAVVEPRLYLAIRPDGGTNVP